MALSAHFHLLNKSGPSNKFSTFCLFIFLFSPFFGPWWGCSETVPLADECTLGGSLRLPQEPHEVGWAGCQVGVLTTDPVSCRYLAKTDKQSPIKIGLIVMTYGDGWVGCLVGLHTPDPATYRYLVANSSHPK